MEANVAAAQGPLAEGIDAQLLAWMLALGSRWVLWLLLALSLLAVARMLERLAFYLRARTSAAAMLAMRQALRQGDPDGAARALGEGATMELAVARAALTHHGDGPAAVREHIEATVERERLRYEHGLALLGTLGNNAPFIGLFGTVLGIIRAFADLSANTAQGAAAVMAGIAEALVATAVGLLVALPAVAAYNACARHVETCVAAAQATGHELLAWIEGRHRQG